MTLSLGGLSVMHFNLAASNMTTLDIMKGIFKMGRDIKRPNIFDLGQFTNIAMMF
jgi:hypothetical protein